MASARAPLQIGDVECVAETQALLGEGPLWSPRDERLYWLDIKGGKLFSFDPKTNDTRSLALSGQVSAIAPHKGNGFVCAYEDGFGHLTVGDHDAHVAPIKDPEPDARGNRFNDGKPDTGGGFWAGTMDDEARRDSGAWWRLAPDGAVSKINDGFIVANGPAFDAERGRVFFTDSARQTVFVAESDGETITNKRVYLQVSEGDGFPDGMELDSAGCLWIAFWDGACIRRFSPEGDLLQTVEIPAPRPTSLAFVENDIYVTSARIGLDEKALAAAPLSGGLFRIETSHHLAGASVAREFHGDAEKLAGGAPTPR